jgi:hypothetical protein
MKLRWQKSDSTHIEAYLGPWHIITVIKEGDMWNWYCELPFSTEEYNGRQFGKSKTAKEAATQATKETKRWLSEARLKQID